VPIPGLISPFQISPDLTLISLDLIPTSFGLIGGDEGKNFEDDEGRDHDEAKHNGNDARENAKGYILYPGIQEPGWARKRGIVRAIMPD
jgi:hypothetical protein